MQRDGRSRLPNTAYYVSVLAALVLSGLLLMSILLHASDTLPSAPLPADVPPGIASHGGPALPSPSTRQPTVEAQAPCRSAPSAGARAGDEAGRGQQNGTRQTPIHVCLCSDDPDLRPAVAAIRSVVASASNPDRLFFHFISSKSLALRFDSLVSTHLPRVRVQVHYNEELETQIQSKIVFRPGSRSRVELASPFNFASFYLPEFIGLQARQGKLVYLDTDTVVLGDVGELHDLDMTGRPCAAVKYCLQRMADFINFEQLQKLGYTDYDPQACIANRGIMVIDLENWDARNMTGNIEKWMRLYKEAEQEIWFGGMSQPPWLLAMDGDYVELGDEWNCNSLGRKNMVPEESKALRIMGFDDGVLQQLDAHYAPNGAILPYIVTCSATAKLLHYNGNVKPWARPDEKGLLMPLCVEPKHGKAHSFKWPGSRNVKVFAETLTFVECAELWTLYGSDQALQPPPVQRQSSSEPAQQQQPTTAAPVDKDKDAKEKDKEKRKGPSIPGGFEKNQAIRARRDILVRQKVMVAQGTKGSVEGPSHRHPRERVNVLFSQRKDGKLRTINVLPDEIEAIKG